MKECVKCKESKPYDEFYSHNGYFSKRCKVCCRKQARDRHEMIMSSPELREKERTRHREKYHRLEYKDKHKPSAEMKRDQIKRYKEKYPEKQRVSQLVSKIKVEKGMNNHHWNYDPKFALDFITLSIADHNTVHRFMEYDQERMMYRTACYSNPDFTTNELLDTRERHEEYINYLLNK